MIGTESEITSSLFQRVLACIIAAVLMSISIWACLSGLFPARFPTADHSKAAEFAAFIAFGAGGFYTLWATVKFRAYITEEGIGQTNGFRTEFLSWDRISNYTMEPASNSRERFIEPVLRDANAKVLLRPMRPPIVNTRAGDEERAKFWQIVADRIDKTKPAQRL